MGSGGQVPQRDVWDMLDACAPGWWKKETDHYFQIFWNRLTYQSFPKARQVDLGHVRKMARHFSITDCAKKQIQALGQ